MTEEFDSPPRIWLLSGDIMSQLGGGFRQQRWCEYYLRLGHSVRLFYMSGVFSVKWEDVHSEEQLRIKRQAWINSVSPTAGVRDSRVARIARLIKHTFLLDLFFPSVIRLLVLLNTMKKKVPGVTILLCSSPPFALALVGAFMKLRWGSKIFMALDMRDLWSLHSAFIGPKLHKRLIESWVIGRSDDFTTVSVGLAKRFKAVFESEPQVVYNVATHAVQLVTSVANYDWSKWSSRLRKNSVKVVYTGSIPQGFYDLGALVESISSFAAQTRDVVEKIQLVFVGAGGELSGRVAAAGLPADLVVFLPQTTHENVAEMQCAADVLLFLGYKAADNQGQVSIKLFEYFRRDRPILPIFIKPQSDVDYLIGLYCGFCPYLNSRDELSGVFYNLAANGPDFLPRANNHDSDDTLLRAYASAASRIAAHSS